MHKRGAWPHNTDESEAQAKPNLDYMMLIDDKPGKLLQNLN
jgi:hypothetical protein